MRVLFAPLYEALVTGLEDTFRGGFHADRVIQRQLKIHKKWGSQDRKLYAEALYDTVRWWRKLLFVCGHAWPGDDQVGMLTRPQCEDVIQAWCALHDVDVDRKVSRRTLPADLVSLWLDVTLPRPVRFAMPDWLDEWGAEELKTSWEDTIFLLNQPAPAYLRVNTLKTTAQKLQARLHDENVPSEIVTDEALRLEIRRNLFLTKAFHEGLFEMQDLNSQKVAPLLGAQSGERVIDACAGAGGKTLHMAALMKNRGRIKAFDVGEKKLEILRERARRAGVSCIETKVIDSTKVIKREYDTADRVLLDVPCSGLGVLRRNPDAKWKLKRDEIQRLNVLQSEILQNYSRMTRPRGRLVYATCSIAPSENQAQVARFLSHNENWQKLEEHALSPELDGPDGFFMALLERLS